MLQKLLILLTVCSFTLNLHAGDSQNIKPDDPIYIANIIPYSPFATVPKTVIQECDPSLELSKALPHDVTNFNLIPTDLTNVTDKPKLYMEIYDVKAHDGGGWGGRRQSITVRGKLLDKDGVSATFIATRNTLGSPLSGTCSMLTDCIHSISEDISIWLKNPVMKARLGDEKG